MTELAITASALAVVSVLLYLTYLILKYAWMEAKIGLILVYTSVRAWGIRVMAKWRKSIAADIVFNALFEATCDNKISNQECKRMCEIVGRALDLPDLLPKKYHKKAVAARLKKNKLAGPKQAKPAWGSGPNGVPEGNVISHIQFLNELRKRA